MQTFDFILMFVGASGSSLLAGAMFDWAVERFLDQPERRP